MSGFSHNADEDGEARPRSAAVAHGHDENNGSQELPLLEPAVLRELEEETGGKDIARKFAQDYVGLWNKRMEYLSGSLAASDAKLAKDAILSVKNSALMVGALLLAQRAGELETVVKRGDLAAAKALLPALSLTGDNTVKALSSGYLQDER